MPKFLRLSAPLLLLFLLCTAHLGFAQVPPSVNSGNPNFPFPQFLSYPGGATLGNRVPEGVPHAELEQHLLDAYRHLCNNVSYQGTVVDGVQYIYPTGPNHCTCAEGDGYYLLAAAYMGDKRMFDGYYMWAHDRGFNRVRRFHDGGWNTPAYLYSIGLSGAGNFGAGTGINGAAAGGNSAADGDVDIALALLVAYKQWGEFSGIVPPATGVEINYKQEALRYIMGISDTMRNVTINTPDKYNSGVIGLDGYMKGGDTWNELTGWATGGYPAAGGIIPEFAGPRVQYFDYYCPAWYRSFRDWLNDPAEFATHPCVICADQFHRGEASSDWLMGEMNNQGLIAFAGRVGLDGAGLNPTFTNVLPAEDMRAPWRTILNYVWNGNPNYTWNPTTHAVVAGVPNAFQFNMGIRHGTWMSSPQAAPFNNNCMSPGSSPITYRGPATIGWNVSPNGTGMSNVFHLNWNYGAGAASAVVLGDHDLMAEVWRQCVIEFEQGGGAGTPYLNRRPFYFHEWFRLLGMLVLTGQYQDPLDMNPAVNLGIYQSVNKTFAYPGDTVTYWISYRNYGKVGASNVIVRDTLPAQYEFVSATGGGTHAGGIVTWNLGALAGRLESNLPSTIDSVRLVVRVRNNATGQARNRAAIWNGTTYHRTSDEYPNRNTRVMERNYVDILTDNPLSVEKWANKPTVNPNDSLVYTIKVKNGETAFLNGGRPQLRIAHANAGPGGGAALSTVAPQSTIRMKFRFYHDAQEPYIDYGNYRISYYMNKAGPPTWVLNEINREGMGATPIGFTQQTLAPGAGYNHRFLIRFPSALGTITPFLYEYSGLGQRIHQGQIVPPRLTVDVHDAAYNNYTFFDDWSFDAAAYALDDAPYFPITNDWTDPDNPNVPINRVIKNACGSPASHTIDNILVEEWDGYTWRRVYGNAPVSGREMQNVIIKDYLPAEVTFGGMISGPAPTVATVGPQQVLTWPTLPGMLVGDSVQYTFWVRVDPESAFGGCPIPVGTTFENVAEVTATNQPFAYDTVRTTVTCDVILPTSADFVKSVNDKSISEGESVTYTLEYTNTQGAYFDDPLTSTSTWALRSGGSAYTVAGGSLGFTNGSRVITSNYAHGTDGEVTFTVDPVQYATWGLAFRHGGGAVGTGQYLTFKDEFSFTTIQYWNGTTAGTSNNLSYAAQGGRAGGAPHTIRVRIEGTTAQIWVNALSGAPLLTYTVAAGTGWVGLINGTPSGADNFADHSFTSWKPNFDSAFEVAFSDPIPGGMSFVSASNSGVNNAGTVEWPVIAGPVLAGTTLTRTWVAQSNTCANDSIENIASLRFLGVSQLASAPALAASVNTYCENALPITWLGLKGMIVGEGHQLEWRTAQEQNVSHFLVQRSRDFTDWETVDQVAATGNSNTPAFYSYLASVSAPEGTYYYRIVSVDTDGATDRSESVALTHKPGSLAINQVYPNPFDGYVHLDVSSPVATTMQISVFSPMGVEVYRTSVDLKADRQLVDLDLRDLAAGTYILQGTAMGNTYRWRVLRK